MIPPSLYTKTISGGVCELSDELSDLDTTETVTGSLTLARALHDYGNVSISYNTTLTTRLSRYYIDTERCTLRTKY